MWLKWARRQRASGSACLASRHVVEVNRDSVVGDTAESGRSHCPIPGSAIGVDHATIPSSWRPSPPGGDANTCGEATLGLAELAAIRLPPGGQSRTLDTAQVRSRGS